MALKCPPPDGARLLTPGEAKGSLAQRLIPLVDRLRFRTSVRLGLRPYNVFLVWGKWTGSERGEGASKEVRRVAIVPAPKIDDLSAITLDPRSGGVLPSGSIRVSRISGAFTRDELVGLWVPEQNEDSIPEPYEFYWEVVEDGRGDALPQRQKFRIMAAPQRRPGQVDWSVMLERVSEDNGRDGKPQTGTDRGRED